MLSLNRVVVVCAFVLAMSVAGMAAIERGIIIREGNHLRVAGPVVSQAVERQSRT